MDDGGKFDPQKIAPSSGELFVGLNILSKIGVIFIIAGFLAFTAAATDMPGILRAGMLFALGAIMAGAGELFYRKGSVVFARTLTLGAIAEWAIAVPVSRFYLHAIAVGLVTSAFALYTITTVLDGNGWVAFTSCIISVIYLVAAAVWIVVGFVKNNTLMRRFGLALSLLASASCFCLISAG